VAVHTQNVLATLEKARDEFGDQAGLDVSLMELTSVFDTVNTLLERCKGGLSKTKRARIIALGHRNPNKVALINAEIRLKEITQVLGLPMLADIRQQLNRMQRENESSVGRDTEALARMIGDEIQRAMMVVVGQNGATVKDAIDSACVKQAR
ncbi:unnamed protein product, partial [Laminaria digitata]